MFTFPSQVCNQSFVPQCNACLAQTFRINVHRGFEFTEEKILCILRMGSQVSVTHCTQMLMDDGIYVPHWTERHMALSRLKRDFCRMGGAFKPAMLVPRGLVARQYVIPGPREMAQPHVG